MNSNPSRVRFPGAFGTLLSARLDHARYCIECETREGRIDRIEREIDLQGPLDHAP